MPRDEDDLRGIGRGRNPRGKVDSGKAGHVNVGDHAATTAALVGGEIAFRTLKAGCPVTSGAQKITQRFPHDRIVVDDANESFGFHAKQAGRFRPRFLLSRCRGSSCPLG